MSRVAYVCNLYPSISNTFIRREVEALRRLGVEVHTISVHRAPPGEVIARADREAAESTYSLLPARVLDLLRAHLAALLTGPARYAGTLLHALRGGRAGLRGRLWQLFYFAEAMLVWHRCRKWGVSHLHAHFAWQATDAAMLAARYGGAGWSWSLTVHGPDEFYDMRGNRLADKVRSARFAVCISDHGRSQLMAHLDEADWAKLRVVHCGVETRRFDVPPQIPHPGPIRVLSIGRLTPVKGQAVLLHALAELRRRGLAFEATLAGPGPKRDDLRRLVDELGLWEWVSLPGAVSQDEIRERYADADVFCLSSFAEGIPVVLMEAMAMRLPVVATRINGIPELVEDGESGLLVPPGRPDLLADALERLASDPGLRARMGEAGRARVRSEFELDRCVRELGALFGAAPRLLPGPVPVAEPLAAAD